ncbi:hypothetical protein LFX25_12670 [Leptospira sp. FAT2]|uniref:hypothetical protein n=1 Tax=Leptospira sanjuanensis TaxID=2879643 RepID=UPI001EE7E166|nr:hypothetical protein [Leptospira sanjuanensis]MCG6194097.1 hypothetical protein [Leptospira sanjuanensis]
MSETIVKIGTGLLLFLFGAILTALLNKYWIRKLFVTDQTNSVEAAKNAFAFPKSITITVYSIAIVPFLFFLGSYFLIPLSDGSSTFMVSFWLFLCLLGIYAIPAVKFYSIFVDPSGITEKGFLTKEKRIFWHDIKSVQFNRFSGNFIFVGYTSSKVKVSAGIKNLDVFFEMLKNHLSERLYTEALEDFGKYQKNLLS